MGEEAPALGSGVSPPGWTCCLSAGLGLRGPVSLSSTPYAAFPARSVTSPITDLSLPPLPLPRPHSLLALRHALPPPGDLGPQAGAGAVQTKLFPQGSPAGGSPARWAVVGWSGGTEGAQTLGQPSRALLKPLPRGPPPRDSETLPRPRPPLEAQLPLLLAQLHGPSF